MEITGTRKIVVIILASVVVVLALFGTFVPESRQYVTDIVKMLLSSISGLSQ